MSEISYSGPRLIKFRKPSHLHDKGTCFSAKTSTGVIVGKTIWNVCTLTLASLVLEGGKEPNQIRIYTPDEASTAIVRNIARIEFTEQESLFRTLNAENYVCMYKSSSNTCHKLNYMDVVRNLHFVPRQIVGEPRFADALELFKSLPKRKGLACRQGKLYSLYDLYKIC